MIAKQAVKLLKADKIINERDLREEIIIPAVEFDCLYKGVLVQTDI